MYYNIPYKIQAEIKIHRSQFIAVLYPVANPDEAKSALAEHQKQYADATHNCYAYICGLKREIQYYADAGEPGGTAGKPILNALLRGELTNTLAVVTRYYGGIKLGVKGLIDAYTMAVDAALEGAELVPARQYEHIEVVCDYPVLESIKHKVKELEATIEKQEFGSRISLELSVPEEMLGMMREFLDGYAMQSRLDYR